MANSVKVLAGRRFGMGATIRPAFENTGIPSYFMIATEISKELLDLPVPIEDYQIGFREGKELVEMKSLIRCRNILRPSLAQTLWAIGYMSVPLANEVSKKPTRFLHRPFRSHGCTWRSPSAWRQVVVRRESHGYLVETVSASTPLAGFQLAYTF